MRGLHKVVRQEIAHSQKLANEIVTGGGSELSLQRRDGVGIKLDAIGSEAPIAVESGKIWLPGRGLLEVFGSLFKFGSLGAHDAQVVVGAGENFGDKRAILLGLLRLHGLLKRRRLLDGDGIRRHASLRHRFRSLVFVRSADIEEPGDALGRAAISAVVGGLFVEDVLFIVSEFGFAVTL